MTVKKSADPLQKERLAPLRSGDDVLLSGEIYTARDAAHKRMIEMLKRGEALPFEIKNAIIYYVGPTPAKPEDQWDLQDRRPVTEWILMHTMLMEEGQMGMIGKGPRSEEVIEAIKKK
jgi:fumarate hydratase subunit beta